MKGRTLRELLLYNYRYIFAYSLIAIFIGYFLFWQINTVGPGLAQPEISSAAIHTNARDSLQQPLYPLFSKLQVFSLKLFPINVYSIRIPSLLIALATLLLLYQVLKKWLGKPTALLSVALVATADWFLFAARLANGGIEFSFWFVVALYSITKILEHKNIYTFALVGSLAALLFVPFGPYLALCLAIGVVTCRVIRDRILEAPARRQILLATILIIGVCYLGFTLYNSPNLAKTLLGIDNGIPTIAQYSKSLLVNGSSVVAVLPATNPVNGPDGIFFVRFFELIFVLFGVFMFWKTRINRLNLIVVTSAITLFAVSGLSTSSAASSLIIVPCAIFITAGLRYFIHRWQKTFPKNPYARMAAIIPIVTLLLLTAVQHQRSYFGLWAHQTQTASVYNYDLKLAQSELRKPHPGLSCTVVTTDQSLATLIKQSKTSCPTTIQSSASSLTKGQIQLVHTPTLGTYRPAKGVSTRALTQPTTQQSIRWVVVSATPKQ